MKRETVVMNSKVQSYSVECRQVYTCMAPKYPGEA